MIAASAAQKNPAEIPHSALLKSMNQVVACLLFAGTVHWVPDGADGQAVGQSDPVIDGAGKNADN